VDPGASLLSLLEGGGGGSGSRDITLLAPQSRSRASRLLAVARAMWSPSALLLIIITVPPRSGIRTLYFTCNAHVSHARTQRPARDGPLRVIPACPSIDIHPIARLLSSVYAAYIDDDLGGEVALPADVLAVVRAVGRAAGPEHERLA